MPVLLLIRHGDNNFLKEHKLPGRLPGIHLNEEGVEQAKELARTLASLPLSAIYTSPLERAIETATPLAQAQHLNLKTIPSLNDTDVGRWAGRSWEILQRTRISRTVYKDPLTFRFPEGESFLEVQTRVIRSLQSISSSHSTEERIAIVFHADPIKLALAHYLDMPLASFQRLTVQTGSISILSISIAHCCLLAQNLIPPCTLPRFDR